MSHFGCPRLARQAYLRTATIFLSLPAVSYLFVCTAEKNRPRMKCHKVRTDSHPPGHKIVPFWSRVVCIYIVSSAIGQLHGAPETKRLPKDSKHVLLQLSMKCFPEEIDTAEFSGRRFPFKFGYCTEGVGNSSSPNVRTLCVQTQFVGASDNDGTIRKTSVQIRTC